MLTTARRIARRLHPLASVERIVVVLKGYIDGSGNTDPNQDAVAVAAWGATEDEWDHWERLWMPFLAEFGLTEWHHTDFHCKRPGSEYQDWNEAKWLLARRRLIEIFNENVLVGIGAAVWRADYSSASSKWKSAHPDPYEFCINECMEGLIHRFREAPQDEGISVFVDNDGEKYQQIAKRVLKWHEDYSILTNGNETARRVTLAIGPGTDHKALQAADILVNETWRHMNKRINIPKLGAIFVGREDDRSPIIRGIQDGSSSGGPGERKAILDVLLYNKRMLEDRLSSLDAGNYPLEGLDVLRRFIPTRTKT